MRFPNISRAAFNLRFLEKSLWSPAPKGVCNRMVAAPIMERTISMRRVRSDGGCDSIEEEDSPTMTGGSEPVKTSSRLERVVSSCFSGAQFCCVRLDWAAFRCKIIISQTKIQNALWLHFFMNEVTVSQRTTALASSALLEVTGSEVASPVRKLCTVFSPRK